MHEAWQATIVMFSIEYPLPYGNIIPLDDECQNPEVKDPPSGITTISQIISS